MTRTVEEALVHAEQQRAYALRDSPNLITDFILLADEVKRLTALTVKEERIAANLKISETHYMFPDPDCVGCATLKSNPGLWQPHEVWHVPKT